MADLSKIMIPNGTTYTIKDETARELADSKSEVSVSQTLSSGTAIASITVDGTSTTLYAPSGGGGGGGLSFDDVYPVGSVYYTSDSNFDPETAFGGTWESQLHRFVLQEELDDGSNAWNYRKWSDGLLECWIRFYIDSMNISTTTGQLKYGSVSLTTTQRTYPVAFTKYPTVTVSGDVSGGNGWVVMNNTDYSTTRLGTMTAYSSASRTGVGVTVNVFARGLWSTTATARLMWVRTA